MNNFIFCISASILLFLFSGCASLPESKTPIPTQSKEIVSVKNFESQPEKFAQNLTLDEFYKQMSFDPNGNSVEAVAFLDPVGAIKASEIKNESTSLTSKLFPNTFSMDTEADAFRHAYFSFRLSQEIGTMRTKKFTDAYEISVVNQPSSRCMDLWNNREGRKMFEATRTENIDKKELAKREVLKAIKIKSLALKPIQMKKKK